MSPGNHSKTSASLLRVAELGTRMTARRSQVLSLEQLELLQRIIFADESAHAASLYRAYSASKQTIRSRLKSLAAMRLIEQQPMANSGGNTHGNSYAVTSYGRQVADAWPAELDCRTMLARLSHLYTSQRSINVGHIVILAVLNEMAPAALTINLLVEHCQTLSVSTLKRRVQVLSKLGLTKSTSLPSGKTGTPLIWISLTPAGKSMMVAESQRSLTAKAAVL